MKVEDVLCKYTGSIVSVTILIWVKDVFNWSLMMIILFDVFYWLKLNKRQKSPINESGRCIV